MLASGLQATWSSRDPWEEEAGPQVAWTTVAARNARKKAVAPSPIKTHQGASPDARCTVILRPKERVRVTDISPKDVKLAVAKTPGGLIFENGFRIRIQGTTNTIAVDVWQPFLFGPLS